MSQAKVIADVIAERQAQDKKWGQQDHSPMVWNAILNEEVGEVARAILEGSVRAYAKELIQVAAVAVAAAEALERWRFEIPNAVAEQLAKKEAELIKKAAAEVTPGEVEDLLSFCPHVPTSIQELLARAIDRKPGITPAKPEAK